MNGNGRILVLYGSQTFTAQEIAERIWRTTKALGCRGPVQAMDEYPISNLIKEEFAVFVCSTAGQGDEPDNMKKFWRFLLRKNLPTNSLVQLKFGVLALGDSSYAKFNFAGKKLYKRLVQLGATPLLDIGLCDYQHDLGHDAVVIPWLKQLYANLKLYFPSIKTDSLSTKFIPRWKVTILKEENVNEYPNDDIYFSKSKNDYFVDAIPFELENNIRTTHEMHFQDVRLITFKTLNNNTLNYKPGDVFNIRPRNTKEDIYKLFNIFKNHNVDIKSYYKLLVEECHEDMPVPEFLKTPLTLHEIASQYWDLKFYPTQYVFSLLALVSEDKLERDKCIELSSPEGQEDWLNYCRRPKRTVLEVLEDFHKTTSKLTIEILFELLSPIKPRSFSIANSALTSQGRELELLVAIVKYYTILKKPRLGLCSNWMKGLREGDKVYGWVKKGTFVFPDDVNIPHIFIAPGTGLAPFRSYIQERNINGTASKHIIHLFFGCRNKDKDFHCREELEKLEKDEKLTLYCAFSRDQEDKIYVQHKIGEYSETLWRLINDKNAHIFISGNAKNMPDNLKDAFTEDVFVKTGGLSLEEAKDLLANMEKNHRLQLETW